MLVKDLIAALKDAPPDAKVQAWQPMGEDGDFYVTVVTYDRSSRKLSLLADASQISVVEHVLHDDALLRGIEMSEKRYVLEGTWSGYTRSQQRIVHREVVKGWRASRLQALHTIQFTDGTTLNLSIRPCLPREKVTEIRGYSSLIMDACFTDGDFVHVSDLSRKKA